MQPKLKERIRASELRKQGLSYSEILRVVPVAKSSLSLWLKSFHLTEDQKDRFRRKVIANGGFGAAAKRRQRIEKTKNIRAGAISEIGQINKKDVFYMGIMLYWAEGAKSRTSRMSQGVDFSNSDPNMCKLF